jgi:hypothetical protein
MLNTAVVPSQANVHPGLLYSMVEDSSDLIEETDEVEVVEEEDEEEIGDDEEESDEDAE